MTRQIRSEARTGFTLVELLVVLAIIAVLLSMTLGAVQQFRKTGGAKVTESNIKLVKTLLERQWTSLSDRADREPIPATIKTMIDTQYSGTDGLAELRARVVYVKLRQRQVFPMRFAEVFTTATGTLAPLEEYKKYLNDLGYTAPIAPPNVANVAIENAVCLLMILEIGPGGGGTTNSELTGATSRLTTGPNGKDVRGLVDGYAQPLAFTRMPTGFANPNPNKVKQPVGNTMYAKADGVFADPADREGHLAVNTWISTGYQLRFALAMGYPQALRDTAFKIWPVVASGGADLQLGLNATTFAITNATQTTDNKYSTDY